MKRHVQTAGRTGARTSWTAWGPALALLAMLALPWCLELADQSYYLSFVRRLLIFALAATSLNLILGYGGMVALGHAAFFGVGAYGVAILAQHGVTSVWLAWPIAIGVAALLALVIGAISLRTKGVYFIMITLAFAQMLYYVFVSLKPYGGEDGLSMSERNTLGPGDLLSLQDDWTFYYVVLACLALALFLTGRLVQSRFGHVLMGIRENEARMEAIGFATLRFKLVAFVVAAAVAALAGALIANQNGFVSPALLHWTQSARLIIMLIMGGIGYRWGGVLGAVTMLTLEEVFASYTDYWHLPMGVVLLLVVLFAPRGLAGMLDRKRA